jgi:hypothetical protein
MRVTPQATQIIKGASEAGPTHVWMRWSASGAINVTVGSNAVTTVTGHLHQDWKKNRRDGSPKTCESGIGWDIVRLPSELDRHQWQ